MNGVLSRAGFYSKVYGAQRLWKRTDAQFSPFGNGQTVFGGTSQQLTNTVRANSNPDSAHLMNGDFLKVCQTSFSNTVHAAGSHGTACTPR